MTPRPAFGPSRPASTLPVTPLRPAPKLCLRSNASELFSNRTESGYLLHSGRLGPVTAALRYSKPTCSRRSLTRRPLGHDVSNGKSPLPEATGFPFLVTMGEGVATREPQSLAFPR